jgi:hypothetical protein
MKKKIVLYMILAVMFGSLPLMVSATSSSINSVNITAKNIPTIIGKVAAALYNVVLALAVIFLLWAAFLYLSGDPKKIAKAHKQVIYAIVSIVIAILAFSATKIISSFLGGK